MTDLINTDDNGVVKSTTAISSNSDTTTTTDEESPALTTTPSPTIPKPTTVRRLSTVSRVYDRDSKGYLDATEQALRRMDSQNQGYLGLDKMYDIMATLQTEQQANNLLMAELRAESRRRMNLKTSIMLLAAFTVLLALTNVATSFAAAKLAKDSTVSESNDLTTMSGVRVGTTSKSDVILMDAVTPARRRHLQETTDIYCAQIKSQLGIIDNGSNNNNSSSSNIHMNCTLQGELTYASAKAVYNNFCPEWQQVGDACFVAGSTAGTVSSVNLVCNNHPTTILGGAYLPDTMPSYPPDGSDYVAFPALYEGYYARAASRFRGMVMPCVQDFSLSMYCSDTELDSPCHVFASWDPEGACPLGVELCGPDPVTAGI